MNRKQRASLAHQVLEELYPDPPIPLDHHDPFSLLVAVLLSAQCTDKMVNRVTPNLWRLARTPMEMSQVPEERILDVIRQLGLAPRKARAIRELSRILSEQYGGTVPADFDALESLPGVGHKTASVVMCQAFDIPAFPVDTHIHRLAQRWGLTNGRSVQQTEKDLKSLFARPSWNKLHLQIIYYGREHCTARGCDGTICRICKTLYPNRRSAVATRK